MTAEPTVCSRCGATPARYRPRQLDHWPLCDACLHQYEAIIMEIQHYTAKRRRKFVAGSDLGIHMAYSDWLKGNVV